MGIVGHCLVKNEERFIWYSITSVIDYLDEILLWDNGSNDSTVKIIKSINNPKIKFKDASGLDPSWARQMMLKESKSDWVFILDGDEIWYDSGIKSLLSSISDNLDCIAVPNFMLIGDIFHYQEKEAGRYNIAGRTGHYNIRAVRNSPGLHVEGTYPNEAYVTDKGLKVQDSPKERILFLDTPYLHASLLPRSDVRNRKIKYEVGKKFPGDFYYPESFFKDIPSYVTSPWQKMSGTYYLRAIFETPLKKIKRRLI